MPDHAPDRAPGAAWASDDSDAVEALLSLTVDEDVAQRHLARMGAAWSSYDPAVVPLRRRRTTVRATAAGIVIGATLVSGAGVAAASTAAPGEPLYGLKTARERLQLSMTRHGESRARFELKLAQTRLGEAAGLFRAGDADRAVETLARADASLASAGAQGGDEVDAAVAAELDRRVEVLGGLLSGGLPDTAADAAREAIDRALDRGARPATTPAATRPGKPGAPADPGRPTAPPAQNGKPDPVPSQTARPEPRPTPAVRPVPPRGHPTGRPTGVPARRR